MSHTVSIKTQFKDRAALASACSEMGIPAPVAGTHDLFASKHTGLAVRLPGWNYPVVIDTATGGLLTLGGKVTFDGTNNPLGSTIGVNVDAGGTARDDDTGTRSVRDLGHGR